METPWEKVYDRFDPEEPVSGEHRRWRVARAHNPADELKPQLSARLGAKRFLLIGTIGTGKSTELYHLAEARTERDFVVVVDLWRFFERLGDTNALNHVQPWELVFLIGLHVYRAAEARGHTWPKARTKALADARQKFEAADDAPKINIPKLAAAVGVLVGGAIGGSAIPVTAGLAKIIESATWNRKLTVGYRSTRRLDQDETVGNLLAAVNALIGDLNGLGKRVACFIDGLDRIRSIDTVRNVFIESSLLGQLVCTTVLTGPILVRRAGLGSALRDFKVKVLANVPVFEREAPLKPTNDVQFFRDVWQRRTHDLNPNAIPDRHLDRLAWACGGRVRQFMRMIREVVIRSDSAAIDVSTDTIIEAIIDEERRDLEMGTNRDELDLLRKIMVSHDLTGDAREVDLLERFLLLPYPNESEWYYPHPLLLLKKLAGSLDSSEA